MKHLNYNIFNLSYCIRNNSNGITSYCVISKTPVLLFHKGAFDEVTRFRCELIEYPNNIFLSRLRLSLPLIPISFGLNYNTAPIGHQLGCMSSGLEGESPHTNSISFRCLGIPKHKIPAVLGGKSPRENSISVGCLGRQSKDMSSVLGGKSPRENPISGGCLGIPKHEIPAVLGGNSPRYFGSTHRHSLAKRGYSSLSPSCCSLLPVYNQVKFRCGGTNHFGSTHRYSLAKLGCSNLSPRCCISSSSFSDRRSLFQTPSPWNELKEPHPGLKAISTREGKSIVIQVVNRTVCESQKGQL